MCIREQCAVGLWGHSLCFIDMKSNYVANIACDIKVNIILNFTIWTSLLSVLSHTMSINLHLFRVGKICQWLDIYDYFIGGQWDWWDVTQSRGPPFS